MTSDFDLGIQMYNIRAWRLRISAFSFSLSFCSKSFDMRFSVWTYKIKRTVLFLVLLGLHLGVLAQDSESMFTIYLVRHAEKELTADNPKDPPLTSCGEQRAAGLEVFLSAVQLDAVYSSDYARTRSTAQPVVQNRNMETRLYDPKKLEEFAKLLVDRGENALVVGHSNSTPVLAGLLIGEDLEPIDESIYNRIYQVVISKDKGRLHVFYSTFDCDK